MEILVLGAAVLDISAQPISRDKEWAQKQRIDKISFTVGGDAANQCIRLADTGYDVGIVSSVGSDRNGEIIKTELLSRNVDTSYLIVKEQYPTGTSLVLLDDQAERTIFSVKGGAYASLTREDIKNIDLDGIKALSIASFFIDVDLEQDGGMEQLLKEAKSKGVITFADLSHDKYNLGLEGIRRFLPYLDYFLPSIYDAEKMNGIKGAEENAKRYKELGCGNVVIKCGEKGCYVLSDEFTGWIEASDVEPVDTTGAGDCMAALFAGGILKGLGVEKACRFACAGASYSTMFEGASTRAISTEEILRFMDADGHK